MIEKMLLRKYKCALENYASLYNNAQQKERHRYIYPLRISGISFYDARKLGFNVTSYQWKHCLNRSKRNKGNFH